MARDTASKAGCLTADMFNGKRRRVRPPKANAITGSQRQARYHTRTAYAMRRMWMAVERIIAGDEDMHRAALWARAWVQRAVVWKMEG